MILRKINFLKKKFNLKYRNILFSDNEYKRRYDFQRYLELKKDKIHKQKKHRCASCDYFYNKIAKNKKNLLTFYIKFNIHLKLKKKYDHLFKASSKKNACLQTYLILLNEINLSKLFNNLQKLNTILKINDLILLEFPKDYINFKLILSNNFEIERKIIKEVLN
jgi:hypothetical protein